MNLQTLLAAIHTDPGDDLAWSAIADCLEEHGETERAELTRLTHQLRRSIEVPDRAAREARLQQLLASGVKPCVAEITNSIGMRLVCIPPGEFLMGSPDDEEGRSEDEGPRHRVMIRKAFYLGIFTVTQSDYEKVMGCNPSDYSAKGRSSGKVPRLDTSRFPVDSVSWEDTVGFCEKMSNCEKGRRYRLPREAEWEYACRAGTTTPTHFGNSLSSEEANFDGRQPYGKSGHGPNLKRPCEVGSYKPNSFGLYDMHGNVWEWCTDWSGLDRSGGFSDTESGSEGIERIVRGGSWINFGYGCRSALRGSATPDLRIDYLGFRVVCGFS